MNNKRKIYRPKHLKGLVYTCFFALSIFLSANKVNANEIRLFGNNYVEWVRQHNETESKEQKLNLEPDLNNSSKYKENTGDKYDDLRESLFTTSDYSPDIHKEPIESESSEDNSYTLTDKHSKLRDALFTDDYPNYTDKYNDMQRTIFTKNLKYNNRHAQLKNALFTEKISSADDHEDLKNVLFTDKISDQEDTTKRLKKSLFTNKYPSKKDNGDSDILESLFKNSTQDIDNETDNEKGRYSKKKKEDEGYEK